jgi:hypothetical protein
MRQISHIPGVKGHVGRKGLDMGLKPTTFYAALVTSTIPILSQAHISKHQSGKRINPPAVDRTQLTGAGYRLVVKFIILLVSLPFFFC